LRDCVFKSGKDSKHSQNTAQKKLSGGPVSKRASPLYCSGLRGTSHGRALACLSPGSLAVITASMKNRSAISYSQVSESSLLQSIPPAFLNVN
jgi:hypothetical protein